LHTPALISLSYFNFNFNLHLLQADGNLLDAASFAAYVALNTALVPLTRVIAGEGAGVEDDFEMDGDLGKAMRIAGVDNVSTVV
jgi:exosome complex RNA-binding protein Rrp42 (RNase PH superfamily)